LISYLFGYLHTDPSTAESIWWSGNLYQMDSVVAMLVNTPAKIRDKYHYLFNLTKALLRTSSVISV